MVKELEDKELLGVCPCCKKNVKNDQLYVREQGRIYHFPCYNYTKSEEAKK